MLLLLLLTMVGRGREEGGCSGGARKGTGPKPKMDTASIAKREKKAARKTAKESLAAFTERDKHARHAERADLRKRMGLQEMRTRTASSSQSSVQADGSSAAAAAAPAAAAASSSASAPAAEPKGTLLAFFAKKPS